jgi:probable rRNA maturation factor
MIRVDVANEQSHLPIDAARLRMGVEVVLRGEQRSEAAISVAVVDDDAIHQLNREYLNHDYPTDVLSFVLEDDLRLEGEIVVSAEYALRESASYKWTAENELLLYVVHGSLHLVGYDDHTAEQSAEMRRLESVYLQQCGVALATTTLDDD